MTIQEVISYAKENGYCYAEHIAEWRGFDVYQPRYTGENETWETGPPYVILVDGDEIRFSTYDETFEFLDWRNQENQN